MADEVKMAKKRARWGSGGYTKRKDHTCCSHPVKGTHQPTAKVEQCCMCGAQIAVKEQ